MDLDLSARMNLSSAIPTPFVTFPEQARRYRHDSIVGLHRRRPGVGANRLLDATLLRTKYVDSDGSDFLRSARRFFCTRPSFFYERSYVDSDELS